ncbi:hypothetical protein ABZW11_17230 [Nonomuraea sp. NPDC004580]|uniref:hypothetical protein n=1 Tax=Nonomuraea sp. NPDC004580 TaxID=3154552 RepID=UPI0033B6F538
MSAAGDLVRTLPPASFVHDDTSIFNLTNSSYEAGTPEVGVYFVAPPSGTVRLTLGGGFRDNTATDRIFLAPELFEENSDGERILAPSVTARGYLSMKEDTQPQYGCRVSLITGLTAGQLYYLRTMHLASPGSGAQADIAARDLIVIPMP